VVGLFDGATYDESSIAMHPADIFAAFSDGVTEPENESGEFGGERLIELIQEHRYQPLSRIGDAVTSSVADWIGGAEQPDDVTVVLACASRPASGQCVFEAELLQSASGASFGPNSQGFRKRHISRYVRLVLMVPIRARASQAGASFWRVFLLPPRSSRVPAGKQEALGGRLGCKQTALCAGR